MPTLTDEIKTFIVKGLACYDTPSQVAEAVKATFGIEVSRQQVYVYDPGCSQPPAQRWRDLHAATRQALLRELGEIGIAHRAVRLRRLDRLESRSERSNVTTALKCLEMAAKECGGMYENRKPILLRPTLSQAPAPQPVMPRPELSTPQPIMPQPALSEVPMLRPPAPLPSEPLLVMPQPAAPERPVPQPQAATPQRPSPLPSASQPPALPEPTPEPAPQPLNRSERFLAYVRDRHERDRQERERAVAAQALLGSARISTVPPAS
jgi:hypothetical protein